jgi:NADH dehydrogenase
MNRFLRRGMLGAVAATVAALPFLFSSTNTTYDFAIAIAIVSGIAYAVCVPPARKAYVDQMMTCASLGIPLWAISTLFVAPVLSGGHMAATGDELRQHFPALLEWILLGSIFGLALQALSDFIFYHFGPEPNPAPAPPLASVRKILILGGGFGGMKAAECLEDQLDGDPSISISLVSETNALLFTPMLAEVAGSSLEASHISAPLRTSLRQTNFIRGCVNGIDLERRKVFLDGAESGSVESGRELEYDHLVLALGAVSNYLGMANVEKLAFNFKSLLDAIRIRNHMIEMFETADREQDVDIRRKLLTFVVAGGGFAGAELAGALNDFAHGISADYRNIAVEDFSVILVHSRDRILPELSESLAAYALEKMKQRGVQFRLGARLVDVQPGLVILSEGQIIAETLIWTAGTAPSPLLKTLAFEKNKRGAVVVDSFLAVPSYPGVWALGDCAAVNDAKSGNPCPPTAQFALREAQSIATNIHATLSGKPGKPFHFDSLGSLCVIGHQTACAELSIPFARSHSLRFSGLLAWLMWRGIYLAKLPGLERKIRVLMAWTLELFFPRDIIQTIELGGKGDHSVHATSNADSSTRIHLR